VPFFYPKKRRRLLKKNLLLLVKLQECDSQLVSLSLKKIKLPEKIAKLEEEFHLFRSGIEQNKRKYDELKARHIESENKIKKINEGMVKTKERLLEVKNNKEYQAILKEIEIAESSRGDIETEIISILEELDKLSILVKKDEEILGQHRNEYEVEKKIIETDLSTIDADTASWEQKRADLKKDVSAEILARYEKVKKRNNGVGVISVWKQVCNGCHMNIPPQLYNELQKTTELLSCPNCNRIMYFQNMEKQD
jgi:predicted  nucleic acid-binding Zn-ribbon protein